MVQRDVVVPVLRELVFEIHPELGGQSSAFG